MARFTRLLGWAVAGSLLAGGPSAMAEPPRISPPRPAPQTGSNLPPLPPAEIDDRLDIGGDEIDARKVETRLTVEVRVNGRGPYHFVVDSGADTSVVGLRIARDLELPLATPVILNNMTDRNIVDRVRVAELALGPSRIRDLELPALREADLGGAGVIGIDALVRQRLMMDFEKRLIQVEDAEKPWTPLPGEIVVTGRLKRGQLILTQVSAAGLPLDAVIDTGTQISIGNLALRDRLLRHKRGKIQKGIVTGVTGTEVELEVAQIAELRLGSVILRNAPIAFADVPPFHVFDLADRPALLLGSDLLETFRRVSLDFRHRKARFQLRRCGLQTVAIGTIESSLRTRLSTTGGKEVCGR